MADRLISADELMRVFARHAARSNRSDFAPVPTWNEAVDIVETMPEAVVRCKDCKHASLTYDGECKYCQRWKEKYDGESVSLYLDGDFYCAWGERKEDG